MGGEGSGRKTRVTPLDSDSGLAPITGRGPGGPGEGQADVRHAPVSHPVCRSDVSGRGGAAADHASMTRYCVLSADRHDDTATTCSDAVESVRNLESVGYCGR